MKNLNLPNYETEEFAKWQFEFLCVTPIYVLKKMGQ